MLIKHLTAFSLLRGEIMFHSRRNYTVELHCNRCELQWSSAFIVFILNVHYRSSQTNLEKRVSNNNNMFPAISLEFLNSSMDVQ